MSWQGYIKGFSSYLRLEKSLSANTIEAYLRDINKFVKYLETAELKLSAEEVKLEHFQAFIKDLNEVGFDAQSQARFVAGIRAFYKYLLMEDAITDNPADLLIAPKTARKLPDTLSVEEINALVESIDLSTPEGVRNRAMLETLYSCGLRVSELTTLKISNLFLDVDFIKVIGKGDKERLVPIGS
ncbi:MAG TPA: site-specific integrase, partial [Chitinophagales bacterium]|nr:site-specific integrase [Chitinophagales bacterium]